MQVFEYHHARKVLPVTIRRNDPHPTRAERYREQQRSIATRKPSKYGLSQVKGNHRNQVQ